MSCLQIWFCLKGSSLDNHGPGIPTFQEKWKTTSKQKVLCYCIIEISHHNPWILESKQLYHQDWRLSTYSFLLNLNSEKGPFECSLSDSFSDSYFRQVFELPPSFFFCLSSKVRWLRNFAFELHGLLSTSRNWYDPCLWIPFKVQITILFVCFPC
jgi:hypothetical protein